MNTNINELESLLTKEQLAVKLGVSYNTISSWVTNGKLTPIRIGGKTRFRDEIPPQLLNNRKTKQHEQAA